MLFLITSANIRLPESVCQKLYGCRVTLSCFISDLSTGFEENIRYKILDSRAYAPFATTDGMSINKYVASPKTIAIGVFLFTFIHYLGLEFHPVIFLNIRSHPN